MYSTVRSTRENAIRANLALSLVCLPASFLAKGGEDGFRDYAEFIRREWDAGTAVTISRIRASTINKVQEALYKLDGFYNKRNRMLVAIILREMKILSKVFVKISRYKCY